MSENGQEKRETLADIVAELRDDDIDHADLICFREDGSIDMTELAGRIEAAWKREKAEWEAAACACVSDAAMSGRVAIEHVLVGNAAAMREALEGMCKASQEVFCSFARETFYGERRLDSLGVAFDKAKAALSAPARQCDVGAPAEQGERCMAQFDQWRRKGDGKKLITAIMDWAQTPYAEEGAGK